MTEIAFTDVSNLTFVTGKENNIKHGLTTEENLTLVLAPVVLLVGLIGNSLSGAVMLRRQFRKTSLGIYLVMLAVADNLTLLSNRMTRDWIRIITGFNIRTYSDVSCRTLVYVMYSSCSISSWLIVAVSIERVLVVSLPFKAKELSTRRRAGFVATSIVVIVLIIHTFIFKVVHLSYYEITKSMECMFIPKRDNNGIDPAVLVELFHLFVYSVVPAIILLTSNIIIMIKLARSSQFQRKSQKGLKCPATNSSSVKRTTWMLIAVSSSFIILTLPLSLCLLQDNLREVRAPATVEMTLFWIKVANHAINFLMYSMSGPAFRRELRHMCKCTRSGNGDMFSSTGHGSPFMKNKYIVNRTDFDGTCPHTHV